MRLLAQVPADGDGVRLQITSSAGSNAISNRSSAVRGEYVLEALRDAGSRSDYFRCNTPKGVRELVANTSRDNLSSMPSVVPPDVDFTANAEKAAALGPIEFIDAVRTGGIWDYKRGGHKEYADFGNFHFGYQGAKWAESHRPSAATGSATFREFERGVLKWGAGFYQFYFQKDHDPSWGSPWSGPPWGDDPADQLQIEKGFDAGSGGNALDLDGVGSEGSDRGGSSASSYNSIPYGTSVFSVSDDEVRCDAPDADSGTSCEYGGDNLEDGDFDGANGD